MDEDQGRWITDPDQGIHEADQQHARAMELLRTQGRNGFVLFVRDEKQEGKPLTVCSFLTNAGHVPTMAEWAVFIEEYAHLMVERIAALMSARMGYLLFGEEFDEESADEDDDEKS